MRQDQIWGEQDHPSVTPARTSIARPRGPPVKVTMNTVITWVSCSNYIVGFDEGIYPKVAITARSRLDGAVREIRDLSAEALIPGARRDAHSDLISTRPATTLIRVTGQSRATTADLRIGD